MAVCPRRWVAQAKYLFHLLAKMLPNARRRGFISHVRRRDFADCDLIRMIGENLHLVVGKAALIDQGVVEEVWLLPA